MLKLWSGDRVFGREARPPEWPYTNSSDRRGLQRKPRRRCRLLVYPISSPPLPPGRPSGFSCVQRTLTDIARPLRRKSLSELMRKPEMHFVTHFSVLLFLRNRGSSAPTGLSRVVFDVIPDRVISSLEPSPARS